MDEEEKFIKKLGRELALEVREVMLKIRTDNLAGLKITKLGGRYDEYRIRVGRVRIQFTGQSREILSQA